jgi:hypothetical protein
LSQVFINADYDGWFAEIAKTSKGISRKGKRILLVESNRRAVAYWHRTIIPKHFESNARSRYHYQRRKPTYRSIKVALAEGRQVFVNGQKVDPEAIAKQGRVDIVRSGDTERKAENPVAIMSTPHRAVATLRVPRHIVGRPRSGRPNQGAEIKKVTREEKERIVRIWKKTFLAGVRVFGKSIVRVRRRISGGAL